MPLVSLTLPADGDEAVVEPYNTALNTIADTLNGGLDDANINDFSGTKITAGTLPGSAFDSSAIGGWHTPTGTFTYSANNGNKEFVINTSVDQTSVLQAGYRWKMNRGTTPPTQCMAFAAANSQYATQASPSGITFTGPFTCEAWIYVKSYTGNNEYIINMENGTQGWGLSLNGNGQVFVYYGASGSFTTFTTYQSVALNQWVHIAGVISSVSGKTGAIYFNGASAPTSSTGSATTLVQPSANLRIGAYSDSASSYFNGYISEARIWAAAQSQSQIKANMGLSLVGTETNLVGLWQGNGSWNDKTSNANNLTATNGAINNQAANPYNTTEYGIITKVTSTQITVFTGVLCMIPNQTLTTPAYANVRSPFGFPSARTNWRISSIIILTSALTVTNNATYGSFLNNGWALAVPTGEWTAGWQAQCYCSSSTVINMNIATTALTGLTAPAGRAASPFSALVYSATGSTTNHIYIEQPASLSVMSTYVMYTLGATTSGGLDIDGVNEIFAECAYA